MPSSSAKFPNRDFNLRLETAYAGGIMYWSLYVDRIGSYSQSYSNNNSSSWSVTIGGVLRGAASNINFDFRGSAPNFLLGSGSFAAGPGSYGAGASANFSVLGAVSTSHWINVSTTPPAPSPVGVDQPTTTSLRYRFNSTGDGGSAITGWWVEYDDDPAFGSSTTIASSGTSVVGSLNPGTTYYFRSWGQNANGMGAKSVVSSGTTLPAIPPGMTVEPSLSGGQATVSLTPPGGASGVTKYTVEYRVSPAGTAVSVDTPTSPLTVTGLVPGTAYDWRASAWFGTYQSPWTDWGTFFQPNPNTSPGNYFDGNTIDTPEVNYSWEGTANNSASVATGTEPLGWSTAFMPSDREKLIIQRVSGGRSGSFGVRVLALEAVSNIVVGMDPQAPYWTDVEPYTRHFGSIYMQSDTALSASGRLVWFDALGDWTMQSVGPTTAIPANLAEWARLTANGVGSLDAEHAIMAVYVAHLEPGESFFLDDVMISLGQLFPWFSGDTPDTPDFDYSWLGAANASISERVALENTYDPLVDPDCPPFPTPPMPPVIASECITDVGEWRRYVVQVPATEVRQWTSTIPSLMIETGGAPERQVRIRAYPNPTNSPPEFLDLTGGWSSEMILSYIPAYTIITLDGVATRVWAQVGSSTVDPEFVDRVPADRLLYGTGGGPASWPILECGYGYIFTLDVPLDAPIGNLNTGLMLTQRM